MILSRRLTAAIALCAGLAACGSNPQENAVFDPFVQALTSIGKPKPVSPTAAQIRERLTPEVRAQLGNRPLKIAVLEDRNLASVLIETSRGRGVTTYFTPDGISISLRSGVVVATRGLGFDLMSADVDDVVRSLRSGQDEVVRIHRYLDGENQIVVRSFVCDYTGASTVTEICYSDDLKIENTYQKNSRGQVVASRQWLGPDRGYIRLESAG